MKALEASSPQPASEILERDRKAEHIQLALDHQTQYGDSFFDRLRIEHCALPELHLDDIDLTTDFLGRRLQAPLLVSCMTGGTTGATRINRNLAEAAESCGVAIGVGSQRKALEDPVTAASFEIRRYAPSVPILANLGAVQLNYGYGIEQCREAVEMVDADALVFHLNPLQEAIQPEGQCDFRDLALKVGAIAADLEVPVIVKEIGCGISRSVAESLIAVGVSIIDVAGLGGTSWARIEAARADDVNLGELFVDWGVPTPVSLQGLRGIEGITLIGSGGVRNGLDAAKAIAIGADLVGLAQAFLGGATESAEQAREKIERTIRELRIAAFCSGAGDLADLQNVRIQGLSGA